MTTHVVILGGGYAGLITALRLASKTRPDAIRITLINASDRFVERIRLHQAAANQPLVNHAIPDRLRGTQVTFVQGWVSAVQPDRQQVIVQTGQVTRQIAYDLLVYALGSTIDRSGVPGAEDHACTLDPRTNDELVDRLSTAAARHGRLMVVGGGLTAIETAAELAEAYPSLRVSLISRGAIGADFAPRAQAYLRRTLIALGIDLLEHTGVAQVEAEQLVTDNSECMPFDVCLWAAGFSVPPLAKQAGLPVNATGQIYVDSALRAIGHSTMYVAGDAAATDPVLRMACATAMPMGAHAADNIAARISGRTERPFCFGYFMRCVSLGRQRGLVQVVDGRDRHRNLIVTGRLGALVKELVCRYTLWPMTRNRAGGYGWPQHMTFAAGKRSAPNQPHQASV